MPFEDPDPSDPMTLHGVAIETADDSAVRTMAECFIEEYARLGFDAPRIVRMFQTAGYAGPNMAWRALGEGVVKEMVTECLARWGPRRRPMPEHSDAGDTPIRLTVLGG